MRTRRPGCSERLLVRVSEADAEGLRRLCALACASPSDVLAAAVERLLAEDPGLLAEARSMPRTDRVQAFAFRPGELERLRRAAASVGLRSPGRVIRLALRLEFERRQPPNPAPTHG